MSVQLLPVSAIWSGCLCRDCGAVTSQEVFEDNHGLCNRCAFKPKKPATPTAFVNGQYLEGEANIRRAILEHDVIDRAVRRAVIDLARVPGCTCDEPETGVHRLSCPKAKRD